MTTPPDPTLITVRDFLRFAVSTFRAAGVVHAHGTTSAVDEAAYLVLETLHLPPLDPIDPWLDARLTAEERGRLAAVIEARVTTRQPAAYLTGRAYIQGVSVRVDPRVIVPRSYIGELLFSGLFGPEGRDGMVLIPDPEAVGRVLDLCTGSGCLAILAARVFPDATIDATDLSRDALEVAQQNVAEGDLSHRITLFQGDLFDPLPKRPYDLILANPPYVDRAAMEGLPPEHRHEPALALDGGDDGLDVVRRILAGAARHLTPGGALLCEVGRGRAALEAAFPDLDVLWLDTAESEGEVFWATRSALLPLAQDP